MSDFQETPGCTNLYTTRNLLLGEKGDANQVKLNALLIIIPELHLLLGFLSIQDPIREKHP